MPFKSEAQRKYLWANEPEIARDWTDTYGSRIQKAGGQLVQPGIGRPGYNGQGDYTPDLSPEGAPGGGAGRDILTGQRTIGQTVAKRPPLPTPTVPPDRGNVTRWGPDRVNPNLSFGRNIGKGLRGADLAALFNNYYRLPTADEDTPNRWDSGLPQGGIQNVIDPTTTIMGGVDEARDAIEASGVLDELRSQGALSQGGRIGYQEGEMVGGEMGGEMQSAMMESKEVIKELYDALIAQGLSPQEAMEKIKEILAATQAEEPQAPMMGEEFPGQEFSRVPAAFGGIMDTYTGRRKYGLGSFFKKATKKLKKLASSKIGKMALMYVATAGLSNYFFHSFLRR